MRPVRLAWPPAIAIASSSQARRSFVNAATPEPAGRRRGERGPRDTGVWTAAGLAGSGSDCRHGSVRSPGSVPRNRSRARTRLKPSSPRGLPHPVCQVLRVEAATYPPPAATPSWTCLRVRPLARIASDNRLANGVSAPGPPAGVAWSAAGPSAPAGTQCRFRYALCLHAAVQYRCCCPARGVHSNSPPHPARAQVRTSARRLVERFTYALRADGQHGSDLNRAVGRRHRRSPESLPATGSGHISGVTHGHRTEHMVDNWWHPVLTRGPLVAPCGPGEPVQDSRPPWQPGRPTRPGPDTDGQ